jgi:hypothetical protein
MNHWCGHRSSYRPNDAREGASSSTATSDWNAVGGVTTDAATVEADPAN